jgi:class 3 adenylate cyclase
MDSRINTNTLASIRMHKEFRSLLDSAHGISEFVIAITIDIRGFSTFSTKVDSADSALYVTKVYIKLIDKYFQDASFYKPTGDGLLVIVPYSESDLRHVAGEIIRKCLDIVKKFPTFLKDEKMIYFKVPTDIGIGLSRGSACRLVSGEKTLDYSGRLLNLSSRLMNLARPKGVVMDSSLGDELIPEDLEGEFDDEDVYIRGVSEDEPTKVHYTKDATTIPNSAKKPLREPEWITQSDKRKFANIKMFDSLGYTLQKPPSDPKQIFVKVNHPKAIHRKKTEYEVEKNWTDFKYERTGKSHAVIIATAELTKYLQAQDVKSTWVVGIDIIYPYE